MDNKTLIEKYVPKNKQQEAYSLLEQGYPIQYIIGSVDFCGNIINVDKSVLIPRFETEILVEKIVFYAKKRLTEPLKIIDLGTGSGCIAISLKKMLETDVIALDISDDALAKAQENAKLNQVSITFIKQDMSIPLKEKYDIIVSNPPYIPKDGFVQDIVLRNEPAIALFAEDQGLYFYKKILDYAFLCLNEKGFIAFEIGDHQKDLLEEYLKINFSEKKYSFEKDLAGLYRYLFIFNE